MGEEQAEGETHVSGLIPMGFLERKWATTSDVAYQKSVWIIMTTKISWTGD